MNTIKIWSCLVALISLIAITAAPIAHAKTKKGKGAQETTKRSQTKAKTKKKRPAAKPRVKSNFTSWDRDTRNEGYRW